jgi:uncharacterized damage-inducible protein DinB
MDLKQPDLIREFLEQSVYRMEESTEKIRSCLSLMDDKTFWHRPNMASNSVGQLLAHLSGNIRQYIVSGLSGEPDVRKRDKEFEAPAHRDRKALEAEYMKIVKQATAIISGAQAQDLLKWRKVQGFDLTGLGIVLHVVEHLSYHTGQIAYITKMHTDCDLGFYKGIDLNAKNE